MSYARTDTDRIAEVMELLFSPMSLQHAMGAFAERDKFADALTGSKRPDVWRILRRALRELALGRPREALERLSEADVSYPVADDSVELVDAERMALFSECAEQMHSPATAFESAQEARAILHRFLEHASAEPRAAAAEVEEMLSVLASVEADETDEALLAAWGRSRGLNHFCDLLQRIARYAPSPDAVTEVAHALEADVRDLTAATGATIDAAGLTKLDFALGDMLTAQAPAEALEHFEAITERLSPEDPLAMRAWVNAGNCLMRLGRYAESEARYAAVESLFEAIGDRESAARVWISECIARWKRTHDPAEVRHSLAGAIAMYEEEIGHEPDRATLYVQKRFVEPGYLALIAAGACDSDRSDETVEEILRCTFALMSRDQLSDIGKAPDAEDGWRTLLADARAPLNVVRTMLRAHTRLGVVHLMSGTDRMVWMLYGSDGEGRFRFECAAMDEAGGELCADVLQCMQDALAADQIGDALAVSRLDDELARLGDELAGALPAGWVETLREMETLIYMPHSYGNVDELPLGVLRVDGAFLADSVQIVRSPSFQHLREMLSPARPQFPANGTAVVLLGDPDLHGSVLRRVNDEAGLAAQRLEILGFDASTRDAVLADEMHDWMDGGIGVLHYLGHGVATEFFEGLPLSDGSWYGPVNADRLDGGKVPFIFACACVAGRIRAGTGGYQTGVVSKLLERGAPAAVAFSMPVLESRAYRIADLFYRHAAKHPFGQAVLETVRALADGPHYARLSMAAFGDPAFELPALAADRDVPMIGTRGATWDSELRRYCALRTAASRDALLARLGEAPGDLRPLLEEALPSALDGSTGEDAREELDAAAWESDAPDVERLSVHAYVCAELLHQSGADALPVRIDQSSVEPLALLHAASFLAVLGGAVFEMPLNGLGCSLMGRVITVDQNSAEHSALYLRQGREKLQMYEGDSEFVVALRAADEAILRHFGLPA
jgi:tetratricopeptide (TPR) repeat protein